MGAVGICSGINRPLGCAVLAPLTSLLIGSSAIKSHRLDSWDWDDCRGTIRSIRHLGWPRHRFALSPWTRRGISSKHANDRGGVVGRRLDLLVEDDGSDGPTAAALYERLITRDEVDAILGLYSSPLTEAAADVIERHRMPMVANAAATSIFKQGRKLVFVGGPPAEREIP